MEFFGDMADDYAKTIPVLSKAIREREKALEGLPEHEGYELREELRILVDMRNDMYASKRTVENYYEGDNWDEALMCRGKMQAKPRVSVWDGGGTNRKVIRKAKRALKRVPLTERQSHAVQLYYYEGKTFDEAGQIMGISKPAAFYLVDAAKKKIEKYVTLD
jgi:DNA-directed RNA polymerase specialized sigma subunit